ncbi:MAG: nucleoside 2-deoxyribosyltransferase [Bacteroidales bacterium]|nr:nucleoside 2-deoxyribosyltransferase [Bacteroidales bacterium]
MTNNWTSIFGEFTLKKDELTFKGNVQEYDKGQKGAAIANLICDQYFGGGKITAEITFTNVNSPTACEIIIYFDPQTKNFVSVGLGGAGSMYSIRSFAGNWANHSLVGEYKNLKAKKSYKLEVELKGSTVTLKVDGIIVSVSNLPFNLPISQTGLWCQSEDDIVVKNFNVKKETPKAFVVMQFSSPYNELYDDVIKRVCKEFDLNVVRADETYGPGLILADIIKQINESRLIIAEISQSNPNVFYEVGYAHALNKPTILIAEKTTKLPFDVSPFRTLFYENTIAGKQKIEDGLKKHIAAALSDIDWNV